MKQNITLSLDTGILKRLKVFVAQHDTSISELFRQQAMAILDPDNTYEKAQKKALKHLKKGFKGGEGRPYKTRDELYDRKVFS